MSEPSPRRGEIVAAARALLEQEGPDALTMRRLAERIGMRAPSLYEHLAGKDDLHAALAAEGFEEIGEAMATCDDLAGLGRAYRRYALEHPHLYRLINDRPLPRHLLPEGLEQRAAEPLVRMVGGDPDLARAAWAFAHGMTSLELAGRFPPEADLDAAWAAGLAAITAKAAPRA